MDNGLTVLNYATPAILVGAGEVHEQALTSVLGFGWPLIAADGGANTLRKSGITPNAIIGDMDSLQEGSEWGDSTRVIALAEQDSTDFEKCIYSVAAPVYVAFGFSGDRFDHTLAALHVLHKYVRDKKILLSAGGDLCMGCCADLSLELPIGTRLSIYPLSEVRFAGSQGLEYPLHNLTLKQGEMIGTSNCVSAEKVDVQVVEGEYAVIVPVAQLNNVLNQLL